MARVPFVAVVVSLVMSATAEAGPKASLKLATPVGTYTTLAMPNVVSSVRISNPALLDVKTVGRRVTLRGLAKGTTDAVITTIEGEHRFHVYVAADKHALPY